MNRFALYCGTRNIYPAMTVAAKSLLYSNKVDRIWFFTEDDEIHEPVPDIIRIINVSGQQWFYHAGPNSNSPWTYMANMRLAAGKVLPDIDRILYLDTDTIVLGDISPVFDTDVGGKLFGMIQEDGGNIVIEDIRSLVPNPYGGITKYRSQSARPEYPCHPYYNSGVMLINLRELRKGIDDILIEKINTEWHQYPDQDIINLTCGDRIVPLPQEYNVIPALNPDAKNIKIKHYASEKPLWKSSLWQKYRRMSWDEVLHR